MAKFTLTMTDATAAEIARVVAALNGERPLIAHAVSSAVESAASVPVAPVASKANGQAAAKVVAKAAKPARSPKKAAVKAAKAPEPEPEEDEEEEEIVEDAGDEDGGEGPEVDVQHPELQEAVRLRQVVSHLMEIGFSSKEEVVAICEEIKDDVPLLTRVANVPDRVGKAYAMLA